MTKQGNRSLSSQQVDELAYAFSLIKAEDDELLMNYPDAIFVPTRSYRRLPGKQKCLVVGRKGAGKSAVTQTFMKLTSRDFSQTVALQADRLMFDRVCNLLFAGKEAHEELRVSSDRVATVAWLRSIVLFSTLQACDWLIGHPDAIGAPEELATLAHAREFIQSEFSPVIGDPNTHNGRFHSLIEKALDYLSSLSDSLTEFDDDRAHTRGAQLRQFFEWMPSEVGPALAAISRTSYRALITLDEFDDFVDSYMSNNRMAERKQSLLQLLKGLVIAVKRLRSEPTMKWLHLLVAVPDDKLLELRLREGATVDQFALDITWTPRELMDYVDRRLTHVLRTPTAWKDLFGFTVSNKNSGVAVREDSFTYIVRHTSMKPRELMMYVQHIFESITAEDKAADERTFQAVVEATNEQIIEQQFIPEYVPEYPNLESLLARLRSARLHTVMSYEALSHHVRGWNPWESEGEPLNPADTLVRLFQMGVVGLREVCPAATARTIRQVGTNVIYHFSFNGTSAQSFQGALKQVADPATAPGPILVEVVFSPLFFEYLRLEHRQPYIVNQMR